MADERKATAESIRLLARWAHGVRYQDLPPEAVSRAGRILGDDLAAIVAARNEPEVRLLQSRMIAGSSVPESTVFRAERARTGRLQAAMANAAAADWLELDEGYRVTPCHAGLYTIPALLAHAEADGRSMQELLRALVVAYEMVTRIARGWAAPNLLMHAHARYAAIGASAATALLRDVDEATLLASVSAAATLTCAGPRDHAAKGVLVRNVWPAVGACNGMFTVDWALCGIGGAPESFHDVFGLLLGGAADPARLTAGLGRDWAVFDGYTKTHACCQQLHSAIEASIDLRRRLPPGCSLDALDEIVVETHPLAMPLDTREPPTTLAAKFSLPHAVAAALATGSGSVEAFSTASLRDPLIDAMRQKVRMVLFTPSLPAPNDRPARITLRFADATQLRGECLSALGGPDRPLSDALVLDKIDALSRSAYPRLRPIIETIMALDRERMRQSWSEVVEELCTPQ